jgi:MYXO-CTERM domain-containing protein
VVEAALSFNVVPAPGAGALGLTSMLLLVARRRR